MRKILTITILAFFFTTGGFCQTDEELMKMWNSESERVGNKMVERIKSELDSTTVETKQLTSKSYARGTLTIYRKGKSIRRMTKTYFKKKIAHTEDYYFSGFWPVYVEIKKADNNSSDKFYFNKTNLMLWITVNNEYLNVDDKNCGDRWHQLLEAMDKLTMIAKMDKNKINEDEVKLLEPPPMTKEDSLELQKLINEFDIPIEQVPDSLKK